MLISFIGNLKESSESASSKFDENSLDMIFLDASHDFESVKNDINAWYPKLRKGGMMAGHDYSDKFPGLKDAVNQLAAEFGRTVSLKGKSIWCF